MPPCPRTRTALWTLLTSGSLLVTSTSGCSTFGRDWNKAASTSTSEPLAGRWSGEWLSEVNGHHGRLRAVAVPHGTNRFRIRFQATYAGWLRFGYTMETTTGELSADKLPFSGEADLGIWGAYRCDGQSTNDRFEARYESKYDHGRFDMRRPNPESP